MHRKPIILHVLQVRVHSSLFGHAALFKIRRNNPFCIRRVVITQRHHVLLERIVPYRVVHARHRRIEETYGLHRRIHGIHRHVSLLNQIVPQYGINRKAVTFHIQSARLCRFVVGRVHRTHGDIVDHRGLQHHTSLVTIDRTVVAARVVAPHRRRQYLIFGVHATVRPLRIGNHIDGSPVVTRIIRQHGTQHDTGIVHINGSSLLSFIIIQQRTDDASAIKVDTTAFSRGCILCHHAICKVCISGHIDSGSAVAEEIFFRTYSLLSRPTFDGHSVEHGHILERRTVRLGEPYHVIGITACHAPFIISRIIFTFSSARCSSSIGIPHKHGRMCVQPRHASFFSIPLSSGGLIPFKPAIHAHAIFHDESRRTVGTFTAHIN